MAPRRLAEDQPEAFAFSAENAAWAKKIIRNYPRGRQASAVIPLLWRAQEQEGWATRPAIEKVAAMLDMPFIRVLEVATFYTMFHLAPVGSKAHVQVCGTTPCMLRGSEDIIAVCKRRIGEHPHRVSADGGFSWEEVECLGACVNAPMVQIFADTYEDLTPKSFERILDAFEKGRAPTPGPQIKRIAAAPVSGLTSLTGKPNGAARPKKAATPAEPAKPAGVTGKPQLYTSPPDNGADDLKKISGLGPKLETLLNSLGIYKFDQISAWSADDVAWVDARLTFKGRIARDDWMRQAKALADGGKG